MKNKAFTLIELLIVVFVLAVLFVLIFPIMVGINDSKQAKNYPHGEKIAIMSEESNYPLWRFYDRQNGKVIYRIGDSISVSDIPADKELER